MCHITHLRKMFKSINTYKYIITLISRRKNPLTSFWKLNCSLFKSIESPKNVLCQVWLKVVLEKISKFCQCIFRYFVIISPWKRAGPFVWTNLNSLYPTMLCAKLNWNWPSGGRFFNFVVDYFLFRNYLLLQKGVVLNLYKSKFPLPKDVFC